MNDIAAASSPGRGRGRPQGGGSAIAHREDFGISESCLRRRLKLAGIDDGVRPSTSPDSRPSKIVLTRC
jgi:hypothetical protein